MENISKNLMTALGVCEKMVNCMKRQLIETAGRENRTYTDEEDWMFERLDEATVGIKRAKFAIQRMGFNSSDEINRKIK